MKNLFIISILFLISTQVFAVEKIYITRPSTNNSLLRPTYNPYAYKSPYYYKKHNQHNAKRIQRLNRLRNLNRLKNNITNWGYNNFNNGTLTGYSLPINQNVYSQMGTTPLFNNNYNFPTYNSLFYDPTGNNSYYKHERFFTQNKDLDGSSSVKIIYD